MISASYLALKIAYLVQQAGRNRFSVSEAKLKYLAEKEVLSIAYLSALRQNLEELGYFLGTLKKGKYCLLAIESLAGAPSLPLKEDKVKQLMSLSEEELEKLCITSTIVETITDNEQDEAMLLLNELWLTLTKIASNKETISYGELAKVVSKSTGYNLHHKKVIVLLESIAQFCTEEKLPPLSYLAINGKTKLPNALGKERNGEADLEATKTQIYGFEWDKQKRIFDGFLNKDKEF